MELLVVTLLIVEYKTVEPTLTLTTPPTAKPLVLVIVTVGELCVTPALTYCAVGAAVGSMAVTGNCPAVSVSVRVTVAVPVLPVQLLFSLIDALSETLRIFEVSVVAPTLTVTMSPTDSGPVLVMV